MQVKENGGRNCPDNDKNTCQTFDASNAVERSTEVAIAIGILVAMAAQAFSCNDNVLGFALRMQLIAGVASAATASKLIDKMRCFGLRPLIGVDLRSADIAHLHLCQFHLLFRAGRMLLFGKMFLAKAKVAIGTAP